MVDFHYLAADGRFKLAVVVCEVGQDCRGPPCRGRRGEHAPCGRDATRRVACDSARHGWESKVAAVQQYKRKRTSRRNHMACQRSEEERRINSGPVFFWPPTTHIRCFLNITPHSNTKYFNRTMHRSWRTGGNTASIFTWTASWVCSSLSVTAAGLCTCVYQQLVWYASQLLIPERALSWGARTSLQVHPGAAATV